MSEPSIEDIPMPKKSHVVIFGAILAALLLFGTAVRLSVDMLWFEAIGLSRVFWTALLSKLVLGASAFALFWLLAYANVRIARRRAARSRFLLHVEAESPLEAFRDVAPLLETILMVAIVVIAYLTATWAAVRWETALKFLNATPFGVTDPVLGQDIAVNVFIIPFYRMVLNFFFICVIFSAIASFFTYLFRGCFLVGESGIWAAGEAKSHLFFLLGCLLLLLGANFHLGIYDLLAKQRAVAPGPGYADINAYLFFLKALRVVCVAAALLVGYGVFSGRNQATFAAASVGIVLFFAIAGVGYRQIVQQFRVGPNELELERPFLERAIQYTRQAYKLEGVRQETFAAAEQLSLRDLRNNDATIQNIRLWDHVPLLTTYGQLQEIRTYYQFLDVDNDRYVVNGGYRQVMLSPRELLPDNLPKRNWINEHLTYTHGYGLCQGPVNRISEEGLPEFFIKDIPPRSIGGIEITRPEIYYGEAQGTYVIVKTNSEEFDYPSGEENVYATYSGDGGVGIGGLFRRLLFAAYFREPKIVLTSEINDESRILFHRTILDRLNKVAPFVFFDSDPYLVVAKDGRLFWFVDGYTYTGRYPYSAATGRDRRVNYLRNSVKTVVDAYTGRPSFYISDPDDPIIRTYAAIFPDMFRELSEMSDDLRAHIRYPHWYFNIQAQIYATYHMSDPGVFYGREDLWAISRRSQGGRIASMEPYYTIMKLAAAKGKDAASEEFILMVPFTPSKKKNMIAWMAARCDEPHYGEVVVYNFPKQKLVYGPEQIDNRIDQDAEIAEQITLWDQTGSRVIRGSLLVIPVEQSLLYVQPLYLEAQGGGLPELRRVIVAHGNAIAMEQNLEMSLSRLFGSGAARYRPARRVPQGAETQADSNLRNLARQADQVFKESKKAMERGDWAAYGKAMAELERLLRQIASGR